MLRPDYPIITERLLLRPVLPSDATAMHAYKSRADVCRYLPHDVLSLEQIIERSSTLYANTTLEEGQGLTLAVTERESGALVGDVILFWRSREHRAGEVGYVVDPAAQGRGYAVEAAGAMLALGFDGLGLHRIVARLDARNTASARVCVKLGMRPEAHFVSNEFLKGEWTDERVYALLDEEWRAR
ncbi:MAG: GNAT family N-acetyltransferase [Actinomycetota bacterium]|nr:GNAT family N-acetyltransferase [Actinomycetota bacterium]